MGQVENNGAREWPRNFYDLYEATASTPYALLKFLGQVKARPKDKLETAFELGVIHGYLRVLELIHELHLDNDLLNEPKTLARLYRYLQGLELTYNAFISGEIRDKTELIYISPPTTTFIRQFIYDLLEKIKEQGSAATATQGSNA